MQYRSKSPYVLSLLLASSLVGVRALDRKDAVEANANPIRKVVTLLQKMQKKVAEEGEKEAALYKQFQCYCTKGSGDLSESIATAQNKMPAVSSDIQSAKSQKEQLEGALKDAKKDRADAKTAMQAATQVREKEAAAFASEKAEYDSNIAAIASAVASLEKGMAGGFLQTPAAAVLKRLAMNTQDMVDMDRKDLLSFLSGEQDSSYVPASGQITGILKELGDEMAKSLQDSTTAEQDAIKTYQELMDAKQKEVSALSASVESKTKRFGELAVNIVQMEDDLSETEAALLADQKFLADLEKGCGDKAADWEERQKTRSEELVALAETIKILNDDDALDLFKSTLSSSAASASFVQVGAAAAQAREKALEIVRRQRAKEGSAHPSQRTQLDLIALALTGKKSAANFDKVLKMIDGMVKLLKEEQVADDQKKAYCSAQFDQTDDKKKELEHSISDLESAISTANDGIGTLTSEIEALGAGIAALDKSVAEATVQRQKENKAFTDLMASNNAAVQLLGIAKNRLNKFYNPRLYKSPPKVELTAEERIAVNMGGTAPPTPAPGGIAGTGVTVLAQVNVHSHVQHADAPPPPPETFDAYAKKSEQSTGVISMLDMLVKELQKEMTEAQTEEKNAQKDYETMTTDSAAKRVADSKALQEKTSTKAELEVDLESSKSEKAGTTKELMATVSYIASLHSECDWLAQYYDVRKEARAGEVDSLNNAKAVLSGASFSL